MGGINTSAQKKLWTFHYHFSHSSFAILKKLFFILFKGMDITYFIYDARHFVRQKKMFWKFWWEVYDMALYIIKENNVFHIKKATIGYEIQI